MCELKIIQIFELINVCIRTLTNVRLFHILGMIEGLLGYFIQLYTP